MTRNRIAYYIGLTLAALALLAAPADAQMVSGDKMVDYNTVFSLDPAAQTAFNADLVQSSAPGNVLWPGDQPTFTIQLSNMGNAPLSGAAKFDIVAYGTKGIPNDIWTPQVYKIGNVTSVPFTLNVDKGGFQNVTITPKLPAVFGAYAVIADLGPAGRKFVTTCVRTFAADPARVQYPHFCLDALPVDVLQRLGVHAIRMDVGYIPTTSDRWPSYYADLGAKIKAYSAANVDVLIMCGGAPFFGPWQPLGRYRPWLDANDTMMDTKFDLAWVPSYDDDFQKFVATIGTDYGWPKSSVNSFTLWNEPWEGISISGWGADMPRYREIYSHMVAGVKQARNAGAQVLVGGCDSTSNAKDKLFGDGKDTFLPDFDFVSIHYQGLDPNSGFKKWVDRTGPNGRVKIWDTESWVANTDDRVAAVVAADRAAGYDRAMGVFGGNIAQSVDVNERLDGGKSQRVSTDNAWSVAAAVGASTHFIGERDFKEVLFKNGLPWVMVFDGLPKNGKPDPDDGTVVVVGDLGEEFGANQLLFRTARGMAEIADKKALRAQLAALPANTPDADRQKLMAKIDAPETLSGSTMVLKASRDYSLCDSYGNPVAAQHGKITVPLDGRGFFMRASGQAGSFAKLIAAIKASMVTGIEPVAVVAHDMLAPIESHPTMILSLTNVLNRPISGSVAVALGGLTITMPATVSLAANETKDVTVQVTGGASNASNTYPMTVKFDAGKDGITQYSEDMHVNIIAHRTITVDGSLDDWKGVLPQTIITNEAAAPTLAEAAWYPFQKFDTSISHGFSTGYLAYDDKYFYFAAKTADDTPDDGTVRFATRNDDEYYYPQTSHAAVMSSDRMRMQLSGQVLPQYTETYTFTLHTGDQATLNVNGKQVSTANGQHPVGDVSVQVPLTAGTRVGIKIDDQHQSGPFVLQLSWSSTSQASQIVPPTALYPASQAATTGVTMLRLADLPNIGNLFKNHGLDVHYWGQITEHIGIVQTVNYNDDNSSSATTAVLGTETYQWPDGIRRYTYRKDPELPSGNAPLHDNVQIAFNVLPDDQKDSYPFPPGTMKGFTHYPDTDYEYALNQVAPAYGGGTEIWRLYEPGMPHKHFYPRQPASPFDGAVTDGKLIMTRDATTRIVECAIPWTEMPAVKAAIDAGKPVKFSFRVNDNKDGTCKELSKNRSVAKINDSFHVDWTEHWANELQFSAER